MVILALVMAGILTMSPYVIRSWNANLKSFEDSAIDSLQDPLMEVDFEMLGCAPSPWEEEGCELGLVNPCSGNTISCSPVEMLSSREFSPAGCECAILPTPPPTVRCDVNNCCCTTPEPTGRCGANATFVTGLSEPACSDNDPKMIPKNPDGTCPDGTMESWVLCGDDDATDPLARRYGCVPDDTCIFECLAPPDIPDTPQYGDPCPGFDTGLLGDVNNSFVDRGACTGGKCETECGQNFVAQGIGPEGKPSFCACPEPLTFNGTACIFCPEILEYCIFGGSGPQCQNIGLNDILPSMRMHYMLYGFWYDHGPFATLLTGIKPEGETSIDIFGCVHQGGGAQLILVPTSDIVAEFTYPAPCPDIGASGLPSEKLDYVLAYKAAFGGPMIFTGTKPEGETSISIIPQFCFGNPEVVLWLKTPDSCTIPSSGHHLVLRAKVTAGCNNGTNLGGRRDGDPWPPP